MHNPISIYNRHWHHRHAVPSVWKMLDIKILLEGIAILGSGLAMYWIVCVVFGV